ncbi:MAG: hypothetical protein IH873_08615 [Chloroflexi bacterium]|nr:hypothetical protein [Chloroflexota bacterium]
MKMKNANTNLQINNGNSGALSGKSAIRLLGGLLLVGMLAMAATFGSVSADAGHVHQVAGSYTLSPPVLSGPPTTENGVTSIAGTIDVETFGTQMGIAAVDFSCTLGTGARGTNECKGSYFFEGSVQGKTGTYRATMFNWTAGGEDAFTSAEFQLVPGSGTGEFSNLINIGGRLLRDEAAGAVGAYVGELEFEVIVIPPSTLTEFSLQELFSMEADGTITTEELVAELTLRSES